MWASLKSRWLGSLRSCSYRQKPKRCPWWPWVLTSLTSITRLLNICKNPVYWFSTHRGDNETHTYLPFIHINILYICVKLFSSSNVHVPWNFLPFNNGYWQIITVQCSLVLWVYLVISIYYVLAAFAHP